MREFHFPRSDFGTIDLLDFSRFFKNILVTMININIEVFKNVEVSSKFYGGSYPVGVYVLKVNNRTLEQSLELLQS